MISKDEAIPSEIRVSVQPRREKLIVLIATTIHVII